MSFRKRGEVLNRGVSSGNAVPGRNPGFASNTSISVGRRAPIGRTSNYTGVPLNGMDKLSISDAAPGSALPSRNAMTGHTSRLNSLIDTHPGVKPSSATSQPTTSTGSSDLDKLLGNGGLPLGCSLLVEEAGTTEFNSILMKVFAAQGIMHNRVTSQDSSCFVTHSIVISANHSFVKELPGLYQGSRKDIKKSKISKEQSKVTVQNLAEQSTPARNNNLKIAWRYGLQDNNANQQVKDLESNSDNTKYNHQFDITTRLLPAASASDITFISPALSILSILQQVQQTIQKHSNKMIRIIIPSLLHPAMYPPQMFKLSSTVSLFHGLKSVLKKNEGRCVLIASVSSSFIDTLMLTQIENLFDSVIKLEPFGQEMLQFLEKAHKSQPHKIQHGLVHIRKLPVLSERGEMHVLNSEFAFRNGRKRFEIDQWSIPVEDEEDINTGSSCGSNSGDSVDHSHQHHTSQNTAVSLDF